MRRLLRQRRAVEREGGFTVVEVTLTLLILSVVMMVAFSFLDRASLLTIRADAHARTEDEVQRNLRIVTQNLRGAHPIGSACTSATDTQTPSFLAGFDNCVQFTVKRTKNGLDSCARTEFVYGIVGTASPRSLVERRREYTGTTASCTAGPVGSRRVLLADVVVNDIATQPLFTYYGADGTRIATTSATAVAAAATVKVTLVARFRKQAPPLTISSSAALRNNISR